jgi:hypothetical protein
MTDPRKLAEDYINAGFNTTSAERHLARELLKALDERDRLASQL